MKNKTILFGLVLLALISIGTVSASQNMTDTVLADNEDYNAEINAEDYSSYYNSEEPIVVQVDTNDGYNSGIPVKVEVKNEEIGEDWTDEEGISYIYMYDVAVGSYRANISLADSTHNAKPVTINMKISKAPVKLSANKWISTTKNYATLKATVKDEYGTPVGEGSVKFSINGKTYSAKVKNGVATKKLKLTNAKTYSYKATFSSKNYRTKTASSKVYVKKAKSYYTFKIKQYSCKMSYSKYVKLIDAKNNKKYKSFSFVAGKKSGKYPIHIYVDTSPRDMQYPKGDYVHVWIDDGGGIDSSFYRKINLYTLNP